MAAINLRRSELADLLTSEHTHAELGYEDYPEQIVYLEKDIIELLLKIKESPEILNDFEILKS